jgi:hypothetical protein
MLSLNGQERTKALEQYGWLKSKNSELADKLEGTLFEDKVVRIASH